MRNKNALSNARKEERQIADELSKWSGMHQNDFERAKRIIKEYHDNNIPANILGLYLNNLTNAIEKYAVFLCDNVLCGTFNICVFNELFVRVFI